MGVESLVLKLGTRHVSAVHVAGFTCGERHKERSGSILVREDGVSDPARPMPVASSSSSTRRYCDDAVRSASMPVAVTGGSTVDKRRVSNKAVALRMRAAVVITVLLATILAAPTVASAVTWLNAYPVGTIHVQPSKVTVDLFGTARLNANTAKITVGGVSLKTYVTNVGPAKGHWQATETQNPVTGVWTVVWTWVPDPAGTTKATIYGYPGALTEGTRAVTVNVKDVNGNALSYGWSFTIGIAPIVGTPTPASGSTLTTLTPTISVPVSDNTGVTAWNATFGGVPATASLVGGILWIAPSVPLSNDATTTLSLTVFDAAGNATSRSWEYYVQTYPPMPGDYSDCVSCHPNQHDEYSTNSDCALCHTPTTGWGAHTGTTTDLHTRVPLDAYCGDCHVSALLSEHGRYDLTCLTCHTSTNLSVIGAIAAGDSSCVACHGTVDHYESVDHTAAPAPENIQISGVDFGTHECDECHSLRLGDLHQALNGTPDCATCHPSPRDSFTTWDRGCVQGGCHSVESSAPMHEAIDAAHVFPADKASCLEVGCHDVTGMVPFAGRSIADLHAAASTSEGGETRTSCEICHSDGVTPTNDCLSSGCHPEKALPHGFDPIVHTAAPTEPESGTWPYVDTDAHYGTTYFNTPYAYDYACSTCHDMQIAAEHAKTTATSASLGCSNCHPTPRNTFGTWDKSCAQGGCHTVAGETKHEALTPAHAMSSGDVAAGCGFVNPDNGRRPCHYADIVQEHNRTISPNVDPPNTLITKTLAVTCEECHSSPAFAALAGNWDGTCNACHDGTALPNHTVSGTARHDDVYAKHGVPGLNTQDEHGWIRVNPDPNSANKTIGCGLPTCHTAAYLGGGWPFPTNTCIDCHDYAPVTHTSAPTPATYTISGVSFGPFPCDECHELELGPEHAKPSSSSAAAECEACHPSPRDTLLPVWDKTTCEQGGCHTATSSAPMHAQIDAAHVFPADKASCLEAGCHDAGATAPFEGRSLADLHSTATTTVAGDTRTSCQICHSEGVTPTNDCLSSGCHPERALPHGYDAATHTGNPTAQSFTIDGATYPALPCDSCHAVELGPEHAKSTSSSTAAGCAACHPSPRDSLTTGWDRTTCAQAGCHTVSSSAPMHAYIDDSHARLGDNDACFAAGCHADGSLAAIHANATATVGDDTRVSCMVCHADGIPGTKDCATCHPDKVASHYDPVVHTATVWSGDFTISGVDFGTQSCSNCHPSPDLAANHPPLCSTCHPTAVDATKPWTGACDAAGCHAIGTALPMHAEIDSAHVFPADKASCLTAGCHGAGGSVVFEGKSIADLHSVATTTVAGETRTSCEICHSEGVTPTSECTTCHDLDTLHEGVSVAHPATLLSGTVVFFDGDSDHANAEGSGPIDANTTCSMCHGDMDLVPLHGGSCALCHSGPTPPRNSFTTWEGGCSQGACHPTYHDAASAGHDAAYSNNGTYDDCNSCHWVVPYSTATPIDATTDWCGGCHTMRGDPTPPRTTANASSAAPYLGAQTFTLTATDVNGSGVSGTCWQLGSTSGPWNSGTSIALPAPASGTLSYTIYWYSTDFAGNTEPIKSVVVQIAPAISSGSTLPAVGAARLFTVPTGVTALTVDLYGGMGGGSASYGARLRASIAVTPGQVLIFKVGSRATGAAGGWGGGPGGQGYGGATGGGGSTSVGILGGSVLAEAGGGGGSAGTSLGGPGGVYNTSTSGGNRPGNGFASGTHAGGGGGWTGGTYGATANSPGVGGTSHVVGNVYLNFSQSGNTTGDGRMIITW